MGLVCYLLEFVCEPCYLFLAKQRSQDCNEINCVLLNQEETFYFKVVLTNFLRTFMERLLDSFNEAFQTGKVPIAVRSRERFTTVTAYRGLVTKPQLLEKLFTRN